MNSKKGGICFRPYSVRKSWIPLTTLLILLLLIIHWFGSYRDNTENKEEIKEVKEELTAALIRNLPQSNTTQYTQDQISPQNNTRNATKHQIFPFNQIVAKRTGHLCYEWLPDRESFHPKAVNITTPIFNKARGMLPGEDGGKHVKENVTIYAPTNKAFRSNWTYTASEGQDLVVLDVLNYKRKGIFVDVGARYWHKGSNSFALEYYHGWKGICVEPDSHFYTGLVLNRSCAVVCNSAIDDVNSKKVHFHYQINGWARNPGNDKGEKYTVTLGTIFKDFLLPKRIDYLSLDIEGYEFQAISTLNLSDYTISVISVERPLSFFHELMTKHGYWWLTHLRGYFGENIYVHESIPNFKQVMNKYRPNAISEWRFMNATFLRNPSWPPIPPTKNITAKNYEHS